MTLRRRLALVSAAAVAVAILIASVIVYLLVQQQLRDQVDRALVELASGASVSAVPAPPPRVLPGERRVGGPPSRLPRNGRRLPGRIEFALPQAPLSGVAGVGQLVTAEGDVFRGVDAGSELPVTDATREVAAGEREAVFEDAEVAGSHVRVFTTQVAPGQAVQVARSLEEVDGTLRRLVLVLALVTLGGIGLGAVLGRAVSRTAVAPIARLTDAAEHVARTRNLERRIEVVGNRDELDRLAASFNAMLEELDRSVSSQRRLVADASHELRTPLTSLRTNIEVLARRNGLPAGDRERLLGDVVAQLAELSTLVGNLVDLAREDEPAAQRRKLRLDELVEQAVARARRNRRGRRFELALEPCLVEGDPGRLSRAIDNLLDNAAKWSPPGADVAVSVRAGEVSVRDHGPGIDPADLPQVFDRFYRAPSARGMPGSGLGLAIVRQVAEWHGGSVSAAPADGGGAQFRLSLPVVAPTRS